MKRLWIGLALLLIASGAQAVPAVTIAQLVQQPYRYADQTVRVTGEVDNCVSSFYCALCPPHRVAGDGQICVGLAFSGFSDDEAGGQTVLLMEETFRFATVEMEAKFEPGCLESYQAMERKRHPDVVIVCTDNATVLLDARVTKVISRKSVLDGLQGPHLHDLAAPPDSELKAMEAEASYWGEKGDTDAHKLFVISAPPPVETWQAWGVECVCRAGDCAGRWPTRWGDGFDSPANPFACDLMIKKNGVWRLVPK